ncbi:hypothetical protein [Erythrobacter sp.]|jgi:hypothetical protein|uniref:hypothetical protein n=1 Tax=Erythrobacter sp. TaxID=1042 RepID=UPI002EB4FD0D|nr:hypothetical protein [Erythrobacter sp.]
MPFFAALAAPLTLILPLFGQGPATSAALAPRPVAERPGGSDHCPAPQLPGTLAHQKKLPPPRSSPLRSIAPVTSAGPLDMLERAQRAQQVRIEQRVTIRISPRPAVNPNSLLARLPQRGTRAAYAEGEAQSCIPVAGISGVQTGTGNRLLLFLRDQRILSLSLERACRSRDFYSGFYVERSEDGQLCVGRDLLQSRSGAKCEVEVMRRLVAIEQ